MTSSQTVAVDNSREPQVFDARCYILSQDFDTLLMQDWDGMMDFALNEGSQRVRGNKKTVKSNTEGYYLN